MVSVVAQHLFLLWYRTKCVLSLLLKVVIGDYSYLLGSLKIRRSTGLLKSVLFILFFLFLIVE